MKFWPTLMYFIYFTFVFSWHEPVTWWSQFSESETYFNFDFSFVEFYIQSTLSKSSAILWIASFGLLLHATNPLVDINKFDICILFHPLDFGLGRPKTLTVCLAVESSETYVSMLWWFISWCIAPMQRLNSSLLKSWVFPRIIVMLHYLFFYASFLTSFTFNFYEIPKNSFTASQTFFKNSDQ